MNKIISAGMLSLAVSVGVAAQTKPVDSQEYRDCLGTVEYHLDSADYYRKKVAENPRSTTRYLWDRRMREADARATKQSEECQAILAALQNTAKEG